MQNKIFCLNCKNYGHNTKSCTKPIESYGIIILKLSEDIKNMILKSNIFNEEINNFNYNRISNLKNINKYKNKIKFLLIEKKNSLNYIEFIRGLYNVNDKKKLEKMFKLMSQNEIEKIKNNNFLALWKLLWNKTAYKKVYQKEFLESYNKFKILKNNGRLNELLLIQNQYKFNEWEVPKGKKKINETNLDCAIREVEEETSIKFNSYKLLLNLLKSSTIQYKYLGTNNIMYKNIFYLSILNDNYVLQKKENKEVKQSKFLTIDELQDYIRDYDIDTVNILTKIFLFIMNICETNINLDSDYYLNA